jgi:bifunctional DNA-binding transcriptional regulator/antitoxin component of YhaV-PrlF toxin-antitoxin module
LGLSDGDKVDVDYRDGRIFIRPIRPAAPPHAQEG